MKKYKILGITCVLTFTLLSVVFCIIKKYMEPEKSYALSSYIAVSNNKGIINQNEFAYADCKNSQDNCELTINIGSKEQREINFEISVLVNYEQQYFVLKESKEKVTSTIVTVNQNSKRVVIELNKDILKNYRNSVIINVRQDIDQLSCNNELVSSSNTVNLRYSIINKESKRKIKTGRYVLKDIQEREAPDAEEVDFSIVPVEAKNFLVTQKLKKDFYVTMSLGNTYVKEWIVWAYIDSGQVELNDMPYCEVVADKDCLKVANIKVTNPVDKGLHELEFFAVPKPFEQKNNTLMDIVSSEKYTVKVE